MNLLPVDFHHTLRPSPMVKGDDQANLREQFRSILGVTHDICWTKEPTALHYAIGIRRHAVNPGCPLTWPGCQGAPRQLPSKVEQRPEA